MSLVPMKKVHLVALKEDKEAILHRMQRLGVVEIRDIEINGEQEYINISKMEIDAKQSEFEAKISKMDAAIKFLSTYSSEKKGLLEQRPIFTHQELMEMQKELEPAEKATQSAKELEDKLSEIRTRKIRLANLKAQIEPWVELNANIEDVQDTKNVFFGLGFIDNVEDVNIDKLLSEAGCLASIEFVGQTKEQQAISIITHKESAEKTLEVLREIGYNEAGLEGLTGTPGQVLGAYLAEETELDKEVEAISEKAKEESLNIHTIEHSRDYYATALGRMLVDQSLGCTEKTFVLNGWLAEVNTQGFEKQLQEITGNYYLQYSDAEEGDVIPSLVDNPAWASQFEAVTDMYSPPSPTGVVDPSPLMGPFFVIFFGMMVSDAVYGIFLALVCTGLYLWRKPEGMMGKLLKLLALGGVSTFVWGLLMGGMLGIEIPAIMFNPMEEPLMMLGLCFALGYIHVLTGMGVKVYMNIKRKKYVDAICDQVLWMIFIVALPMMMIPGVEQIGTILSLISGAGILLTGGRAQKNIFKKFTSGLLSLYDITGFLSDILSYSRLFALGLATGVIASVIGTIAGMLGGSIIGYIFMAAVLVGGHLFNVAINSLGAFVHACRLQYIEYFGKFYESGGKPFSPLVYDTRYLRVCEQKKK